MHVPESVRFPKSTSPVVFHIDIDAFFASVEQLLIPRLRGRPVAVGNGVIASCSYEARRFGLRAGTPLWKARQVCPELVILDGQYPIYRCFAEHVWDICRRYTNSLETFLDEAYGDVRGCEPLFGRPAELGRSLRETVLNEVGLSASVGLAANRMLAKLASKAAKPAGVRWIAPEAAAEFLAELPVTSLLGVGGKTAALLDDLNIHTVADLRRLGREDLKALLGQRGEALYERCRGRDVHPAGRPTVSGGDKPPRTISRETTFHKPESDPAQVRAMLFYLLERAMRTLRAKDLAVGTVELTLRYDDWKHAGARRSLTEPTQLDGKVFEAVLGLFRRLYTRRVALRHVGVVLSSLRPHNATGGLFDPPAETRDKELNETVDAIRDRWGHAAVVKGDSINLLGRLRQDDYGFVLRTPSLTK